MEWRGGINANLAKGTSGLVPCEGGDAMMNPLGVLSLVGSLKSASEVYRIDCLMLALCTGVYGPLERGASV